MDQGWNGAAEQGKEHHDAHHREAGFVGTLERWIGFPGFRRIGQRDGGAIDGLQRPAPELGHGRGQPVSGFGRGRQAFGEFGQGQAPFGAAVGPVLLRNAGSVLQSKEGLELTDDLPAGGVGIEALPEHAPEGAPAGVVAVAAVLVVRSLWEKLRGDP